MRLICERDDAPSAFPIGEGEAWIGRGERCEVHVPDASLSKRHARLLRRGATLTVFDAGSRNGTVVDGETLGEGMSREVGSGSTIQCGKLSFRVEGALLRAGETGGAPPVRLTLRGVEPPRSWELRRSPARIGALPDNDVVLEGDGISRAHAELVWEEGRWLLRDLGSRNGVFVNGERADLRELREGDELQVGVAQLGVELLQVHALTPVLEVLTRYQERPLESFKEDPRLRRGVAAALTTALILLLGLLQTESAAEAAADPALVWLEEATARLAGEDYRGARDGLHRAMAQGEVGGEHARQHRAMTAVATLWAELDPRQPDWFMRFRWRKADDLLRKVAELPELPASTCAWLAQEQAWVTRHAAAYDQLGEGQTLAASAAEQVLQGALGQAVPLFRQALASYEGVDPGTPLAARGRESARLLRRQALELFRDELRRRLETPTPSWDECQALAIVALEFATRAEERAELRRSEEECDRNRRDDARYTLAVEIVQARDTRRYDQAVQLLRAIAPTSRIVPDAMAYLDWIDADLKVREAQEAWNRGEDRRALDLLDRARKAESLGLDAVRSVETRRQTWSAVSDPWQRGLAFAQAGQNAPAKAQLARVLLLEPRTDTWYHRHARERLERIRQQEASTLERRLREGERALEEGRWEECLRWFEQVREDPTCGPAHLARVRSAVVAAKRAQRLVLEVKQALMRGNDASLPLYYRLRLLSEWLPPDDPDRADMQRRYEQVKVRLNLLLQNGRPRRPG